MKVYTIVGHGIDTIYKVLTYTTKYEADYQLYRISEEENRAGQRTDLNLDDGLLLVTDNEEYPHLLKTYQIYESELD